jgi:hypothetical protein
MMNLLNLPVDPTGIINALNEQTFQLKRIADVLEYAIPRSSAPASDPVPESERTPVGFSFAESPDDYAQRMVEERAFAASLGLAQWSPALQDQLINMRRDLMQPRFEYDHQGNQVKVEGKSEAEANAVIQEAFDFAKSAAYTAAAIDNEVS